jgi:DNA-binding CsgD family transcriptional regulator
VGDVHLSEKEQAALRFLLAAEPVAGQPLPRPEVLERLADLVRCDTIGAAVTDPEGYVVDRVEVSHDQGAVTDAPSDAEASRSIAVEFRNDGGRLVEVWCDRRTGEFSPRDVAVLTMIAPAVQRLVRDAAGTALPASLTAQERRTLMLVAAGFSNAEIARRMGVATCTVRKHLEHAYRKLGVTNRLAAAIAVRRGVLPEDSRKGE